MARALMLLALGATFLSTNARAESIEIRGNIALPSAVYHSTIVLSDLARTKTATIPEKRSEEIARSVLDFLLASGYDLANVEHDVQDDRIVVTVDEGRLDKIIYLRQGTLRTLEAQLTIKLPGDVFNRPLLQQQLEQLKNETDITEASFEVLPVEEVHHAGLQIKEQRLLKGLQLLRAGGRYELHIILRRPEEREGARLSLGISSPDGFYTQVRFDESNLILARDRMAAKLRVGFHLNDDIDTPSNPVGLSRLQAGLQLHTPPFGESISSFLEIEANMYGRLRRDLDLANYYYVPLEASLNAQMGATETLDIALGIGLVERLLFGIDPVDEVVSPLVEATEQTDLRVFIEGEVHFDFEKERLRLDRPHELRLRGRFLAKGSLNRSDVITKLHIDYENTWPIGFDEFHLGSSLYHVFGTPFFYDELSIGDGFLRAAFGNDIYLRRALGVSAEYRISLSRDVVKVSIFDDAALYEGLDAARDAVGIRAATTFGLGLHVLILDAFQLNAYGGIGLAPGREIGFGFALSVKRAY